MSQTFCARCGGPLAPGMKFCQGCGAAAAPPVRAQQTSAAPSAAPQRQRDWVAALGKWLAKNLWMSIVFALLGAGFAWLANVYFMAMAEGYNDIPGGSWTTGRGNLMHGTLLWTLASTVVFGVVGYWWSVGTERFIQGFVKLPESLGALFGRVNGAHVALLWGFAVALFGSTVMSRWICAAAAVVVALSLPTVAGRVVSSMLFKVWSQILRQIAPGKQLKPQGMLAVAVGMLGGGAALAVGGLVGSTTLKLGGSFVCAIAAFILTFAAAPPATATALCLAALVVFAWQWIDPAALFADDGGWKESGGNLRGWVKSSGAGKVMSYATGGALGAALGGALGPAIGGLIGNLSPDDPWWIDIPEGDEGEEGEADDRVVDPYTGDELPRWTPDSPEGSRGPGEPGQVLFQGRWVDPADARQFFDESEAADRRRQAESDRFHDESVDKSTQWLEDSDERADRREQQILEDAEREAAEENADERRARAYEDQINRATGDLTGEQAEAVDRILRGIDTNDPSPEDLDELTRLAHAIHNLRQGASEFEGAEAEQDALDWQGYETGARRVEQAGRRAGYYLEGGPIGMALGGGITDAIFDGAGAAGRGDLEGVGAAMWNGAVAGTFGRAGDKLDDLVNSPIGRVAGNALLGGAEESVTVQMDEDGVVRDADGNVQTGDFGTGALMGGAFSAGGHGLGRLRNRLGGGDVDLPTGGGRDADAPSADAPSTARRPDADPDAPAPRRGDRGEVETPVARSREPADTSAPDVPPTRVRSGEPEVPMPPPRRDADADQPTPRRDDGPETRDSEGPGRAPEEPPRPAQDETPPRRRDETPAETADALAPPDRRRMDDMADGDGRADADADGAEPPPRRYVDDLNPDVDQRRIGAEDAADRACDARRDAAHQESAVEDADLNVDQARRDLVHDPDNPQLLRNYEDATAEAEQARRDLDDSNRRAQEADDEAAGARERWINDDPRRVRRTAQDEARWAQQDADEAADRVRDTQQRTDDADADLRRARDEADAASRDMKDAVRDQVRDPDSPEARDAQRRYDEARDRRNEAESRADQARQRRDEAQAERDQARQQRDEAESRRDDKEREAERVREETEPQIQELQQREQEIQQRVDDAIQNRFTHVKRDRGADPDATEGAILRPRPQEGDYTLARDTTELARQRHDVGSQDRPVRSVRDPDSGVEVSVGGRDDFQRARERIAEDRNTALRDLDQRVADPDSNMSADEVSAQRRRIEEDAQRRQDRVSDLENQASQTPARRESMPEYEPSDSPRAGGFNVPGTGRSASVESPHAALHERVHAHTNENWRSSGMGQSTNMNEGMTEHMTRRLLDDNPAEDLFPGGEPIAGENVYRGQRGVVNELDQLLGDPKYLEGAYFHGENDELYEQVARRLGHEGNTDELRSRGRGIMDNITQRMDDEDYTGLQWDIMQAQNGMGALWRG